MLSVYTSYVIIIAHTLKALHVNSVKLSRLFGYVCKIYEE